jgi:hypothetical protein
MARSKCSRYGETHVVGTGRAANIWGAWRAVCWIQHFLYGRQHRVMRIAVAKKIEHHGAAPDLTYWVGNATARYVRRRSVHRLKKGRKLALGVQVGAGGNANSAGTGRP